METTQQQSKNDEEAVIKDTHCEKLLAYCRICGKASAREDRRKLQSAAAYKNIILHQFQYDIDQDISGIHPPFICRSCENLCIRAQKRKNKNLPYKSRILQLKTFAPHSIDCIICGWERRKTPRKTPKRHLAGSTTLDHSPQAKKKLMFAKETFSSPSKLPKKHWPAPQDDTTVFKYRQFKQQGLAWKIRCVYCEGVPSKGTSMITQCKHILCFSCIDIIHEENLLCPACKQINTIEDMTDCTSMLAAILPELDITCRYSDIGCEFSSKINDLCNHEAECLHKRYPARLLAKSKPRRKLPQREKANLGDMNPGYVKRKRLKELISFVRKYCKEHNEKIVDTLFFMLKNELQLLDERDRIVALDKVWETKSKGAASLTPEECLAIRVENLQSKTQYTTQYQLLKSKNEPVFQSIEQVNKVEKRLMPPSCGYDIVLNSSGDVIQQIEPGNGSTVNINQTFSDSFPEMSPPNCKGVRWHYSDAIASTLNELDNEIEDGLQSLDLPDFDGTLTAIIKDGGDGMGDCSIYKEKGDRKLPNNAFRYAFCILSVQLSIEGNDVKVYECDSPNSVRTNRPILEAIADENNKCSAAVCLAPIEMERMALTDKTIIIKVRENQSRKFKLKFFSSMEDEKFDRAFGGLQGAGSSYICTLCHATETTAYQNIGQFHITRTLEEAHYLADYVRANPDKLSEHALSNIAKGVKSVPLLMSQPAERMLDATHADINMARFFRKIIIRLIANVRQWEATAAVNAALGDAEVRFDRHIKKHIGNAAMILMPGNYARMLFKENNATVICGPITNEQDRKIITELLSKFRQMRAVYRANKPTGAMIDGYKQLAVSFAQQMKNDLPFVRWPNYMHKLVEHVAEILQQAESPVTSVGAMSGEGLEAGNKLFRHIRKNLSNKGATIDGLNDVLKLHWLYSSPFLQKLAEISRNRYQCGLCGNLGHNRTTCSKSDT